MEKLFNKVLNFVGWEAEEEIEAAESVREEREKPKFQQSFSQKEKKIVNIRSNNQLKVVIVHPGTFDDAQEICDHLKCKKPIVMNLEDVEREDAQRIVDFLSGSVYALDGSIKKVSHGIFLIAPNNVDIMGDIKDEMGGRSVFPWAK